MARGEPLLMRSGLTNRIYVVTAYKDLGNGQIEATKKYDVTEQFDALVESGAEAVTQKGKTHG